MLTLTLRNWSDALCLLFALGLFSASPAQAQEMSEVEACAAAYEQAQVTRNDGKLKQAQEHLGVCVRDVCPEFVKVDCGQWLSEVKREVPSVIFSAIDSKGDELTQVKVSVDGEVVAETLDGIPIDLDPGPHEVVFEFDGKTQDKQLIIRQGEKNRVFRAQFVTTADSDGDGVNDEADLCPNTPGALSDDGCPSKAAMGNDVAASAVGGTSPMAAYVLWGIGGLGFATAGIAGLMKLSLEDEAEKECPWLGDHNPCSSERRDDYIDRVDTRVLVANIGLGVGATGAVAGTVLFFLARSSSSSPDAAALKLDATPIANGGFFSISGGF